MLIHSRNLTFGQADDQRTCLQIVKATHDKAIRLQSQLENNSDLLETLTSQQKQISEAIVISHKHLVIVNERMLATNERAKDSHHHLAAELHQALKIIHNHSFVPPEVLLQKPVTLVDDCEEPAAFHLDCISSYEAFRATLRTKLRQGGIYDRGIKMLDASKFVLEDYKGVIDLSTPWEKMFRPNQIVHMSMVFQRDLPIRICPVCDLESRDEFEEIMWYVLIFYLEFGCYHTLRQTKHIRERGQKAYAIQVL